MSQPLMKATRALFWTLTLLLFTTSQSYANVSTAINTNGVHKPAIVEMSDKYLIKIAKPNSVGLSINQLSELDSKGKRLVLANSRILNSKLSSGPAQTIILEVANKTSIAEVIVEGRAADVVLVAPKGIICNGCSIKNTQRITLATGSAEYEDDKLQSINVKAGNIVISGTGLSATESSVLDIAAGTVTIDGPLTTNMKGRVVTRNNQEVKEIDVAGTLEVSNGDVQVIVGENKFRYTDRQSDASFKSYDGNAITLTNRADIKVGNLHLESTYDNGIISVDGKIQSNGAWSYVGRLNNQSIIPLESVKIKSNGNINILDQIIAANRVDIESTRNISLTKISGSEGFKLDNIRGSEVSIASTGMFENTGAILSEDLRVTASKVINEGDFESSNSIYLDGKSFLKNQFGGAIFGENIVLKSSGDITNGSLYPYRPVLKSSSKVSSYAVHSDPEIQVGGFLSVPELDSEQYIKAKVDSLESFIIGQNIRVEAKSYINANPYKESRKDIKERNLQLNYNDSSQVIISAESTLEFKLKNQFWNISAIAESWAGNMIFNVPRIKNERYHIWADTMNSADQNLGCDSFSYMSMDEIKKIISESDNLYLVNSLKRCFIWRGELLERRDNIDHQGISINIDRQYIKVLSPPSRINVGNSLILSSDSIDNEHSSVEVRKDVIGRVNNVWMEGLELREIWHKTTTTYYSRTYCSKRIFKICVKRKTERWTTSKTELEKDDTVAEFPYVFYVDGHIHEGFGSNYSIMQSITFGPNATSYTPRPTPTPATPSKYIPIVNDGITFFIPNPKFQG